MTIQAWRIIKAKHAANAFTGVGARRFGGRWNSAGVAMIYTAGSVSLAILEMLVHLQSHELMQSYVIYDVAFDERLVTEVDAAMLPKVWRKSPAPRAVQKIGDTWITGGGSVVLRVPSVIVPTEWNYLVNPNYPDFAQIAIGKKQAVRFDPRLIKAP